MVSLTCVYDSDCYVAVTGVPEPQAHHAVIMVRFARESMSRLRTLTQELRSTLGDDTVDLNMRVGIHSGPITGKSVQSCLSYATKFRLTFVFLYSRRLERRKGSISTIW